MKTPRRYCRYCRYLWLPGLLLVLAALGWWGLVFRQVVAYDYLTLPQAAVCLGLSTSVCELAMSLCSTRVRHLFDIGRYSPDLLWAGLALISAQMALAPAARARRA